MMLTVATRALPFSLLGHGGGEGADLYFRCWGEENPWWRDPETGGVNGVARRSLIAAAAQDAVAALASARSVQFETWRTADWGEAAWRGDDGIEGWTSLSRRWRAGAGLARASWVGRTMTRVEQRFFYSVTNHHA